MFLMEKCFSAKIFGRISARRAYRDKEMPMPTREDLIAKIGEIIQSNNTADAANILLDIMMHISSLNAQNPVAWGVFGRGILRDTASSLLDAEDKMSEHACDTTVEPLFLKPTVLMNVDRAIDETCEKFFG